MKKQVALLLIAGILSTSVFPASAAFKQGKVVSVFETGFGYSSTAEDANLPNGWETLYAAGHNEEVSRAKKVDSMYDNNRGNVLVLNGLSKEYGAAMRYAFDEVIKTGKIHAGFSMKVEDNANGLNMVRFGGHYVQNGIYNPDNYWGYRGNTPGGWTEKNTYLLIDSRAVKTYSPVNLDDDGNKKELGISALSGLWYRYDLYFNLEGATPTYDIYVNGEKITTSETLTRALLKSFWFQADVGTAYIDDIVIEHYQEGDFDRMQAVADYNSNGVAIEGGSVNISFSEPVKDLDKADDTYFTIKNAEGQVVEVINDYSCQGGKNNILLQLYGLEYDSTYTVEISPSLVGAISGTTANPVTFRTEELIEDYSGPNYYLNEDFENYAGNFPVGWGNGYGSGLAGYTTADIKNFKMVAGEGKNGGKALQFASATSGERAIEYKFPHTIYDGKFTIEFDVYHDEKARWALGLFTPAEYRNDLLPSADSTKSGAEALEDRRNNSLVMATFATDSAGNNTLLSTNPDFSNWISGSPFSNVSVPGGKWTNVKLVVDPDGDQYTVTTTDEDGNSQTGTIANINRLGRRTLYKADTKSAEDIYGFAGLRLVASKNADVGIVKFDNIKVYNSTDKQYNAYEDFNTIVRHNDHATDGVTNGRADTIMYNMKHSGIAGRWDYFNVDYSGSEGKALKVHTAGNITRMIYRWLSVPIKAGASFKVEFDIKNDANYSANNYKGGAWELAIGNYETVSGYQYPNDMNRIVARPLVAAGTTPILTAKGLNSSGTEAAESTGITFDDGVWNRIEVFVNNEENTMTITKKDISTNKVLGSHVVRTSLPWLRNTELDYIGFRVPWNCGPSFSLDNIKVYETNPICAEVKSVKVVGYDGAETAVSEQIPNNFSHLEVSFSHPIADTDAVKLVYNDIGTADSNRNIAATTTLADGGKTVKIVPTETLRINENIAVEIDKNLKFADTYMTNFTPYNKVFKLTQADSGDIVVTDFRLYMKEVERTDTMGHTYPEIWVPYFGDLLTDLTSSPRDIRLQVKGYNTGSKQKLFISGNNYTSDENIKELTRSQSEVIEVDSGTFEWTLPIENVTSATGFKGLLWKYPSMEPVDIDIVEYAR